jgi:hypothetical protein
VNAAWVTAATALAAAIGGVLVWCARWALRVLLRTRDFLDDWGGQPARPGVEARPGVMARLQAVETAVAKVLAQTQPDHGHSLRDVVHQIREDVSDVKNDQAAMRARMELFEHERESREGNNHG